MRTLLAILFSVLVGTAHATTIAVTQGSGTNMLVHADGSSNNAPAIVICDQTNPDTCIGLGQTTAASSMPVVQPLDLTPASGNITAADAASSSTTGFNSIPFYTGTPTANSAVSLALNGQASLTVQLTGTWSATIQFEESSDGGTTWTFVYAMQRGAVGQTTPSIVATGTAGDGMFDIPVGSATNVRVRAVSYTSGTVTVKFEAAVAAPPTVWAQQGSTFSVSENGTFATNDNVNQWNGQSLGNPSNYGTSPGAVSVPGVNAFVTNIPQVDILGHAGAAMDAAGQNVASPANELLIGGQFNTSPTTITSGNMSPLQLDASARLLVNCATGCSGGGGTSLGDEGTFTQGTTNFTPIGGFFNTSITNLTSGQAGSVRMLADRSIFVNLDSVGGTAFALGQTTAAASLPVVQPTDLTPASGSITTTDSGSTSTTGANSVVFYTGTATTTSVVTQALNGQATVGVQLTGTWSATVSFEVSADSGTTWTPVFASQRGITTVAVATEVATGTTGDGVFDIPTGGATNVRVHCTAFTSGTVTVKYEAAMASPPVARVQQAGALTIGQSATAWVDNITQWNSVALGSPSNYGTSPGAVSVPGVNAFVTNTAAVNLSQVGGNTVVTGGTNGSQGVGGLAASGAAVAGNPVLGGCRAQNAEPTAVTNGQAVDNACGLEGKQITLPYANKENYVRGQASATGTSATTIIAAGGASVKNYITSVQCSRSDAGTSAIEVTFNDSASTEIVLPNTGGGGGSNLTLPVPLVTAANTAFTFTASAATTTVFCSAQGYTGS